MTLCRLSLGRFYTTKTQSGPRPGELSYRNDPPLGFDLIKAGRSGAL